MPTMKSEQAATKYALNRHAQAFPTPLTFSAAARSVWAKSPYIDTGDGSSLSLVRHLGDTMAVAEHVWNEFLPQHPRQLISDSFGSDDAGRTAAMFLAGTHDSGKCSPAFSVMQPHLAQKMSEAGLRTKVQKDSPDRSRMRHELVGYLALRDWLEHEHGFQRNPAEALAMIVGAHHGAPPDIGLVDFARDRPELSGEDLWIETRNEFFGWAAVTSGAINFFQDWTNKVIPQPIQVLLSGIVIIADWIASNERYFPYDEAEPTQQRADRAWRELALPGPWVAPAPPEDPNQHLQHRFALPGNASIRPLQRAARQLASEVSKPCLMIIEAAMGDGKTEASWLAAEVLAHRFGLGGVYDALPTQATSNAIFERMDDWITHLDSEEQNLQSIFLAHNKRGLNDNFQQHRYPGHYSGVANDDNSNHKEIETVVHSWLNDRKRGMLSSFVTGTIDQVLMMALKSRHLALRHLALAGKVVILDEVHSYDDYMNVYLDRALQWLAAYEVPVIVLSATLSPNRREELLTAYETGRASTNNTQTPPASDNEPPHPSDYPLITITEGKSQRTWVVPETSGRNTHITALPLSDDDNELVNLLDQQLTDGGCAIVIRNTVLRAQHTAEQLKEHFKAEEVTLAHARFLAFDRAASDQSLLDRFGKPELATRPKRHIVIATQVAEQSLDIDFDLMVTDLAPMDLLLQRSGRLHRHGRNDRPIRLQDAQLYVVCKQWNTTPPEPPQGSARIYGNEALLRSLAVLGIDTGQSRTIKLPTDIPQLVATAYDEQFTVPTEWEEEFTTARAQTVHHRKQQQVAARPFLLGKPDQHGKSLRGWIKAGVTDPEAPINHVARASVRDGLGGVEVVVLFADPDNEAKIPEWHPTLGGEPVPLSSSPSEWRLRQAILTSTIQLGEYLLGGTAGTNAFIEELETRNYTAGWDGVPSLRGQLLMLLDPDGTATVNGQHFEYSQENGMVVTKQ